MKAFLSRLDTADPLPSEKIGEGAPSLIFFWGKGAAVHRLFLSSLNHGEEVQQYVISFSNMFEYRQVWIFKAFFSQLHKLRL